MSRLLTLSLLPVFLALGAASAARGGEELLRTSYTGLPGTYAVVESVFAPASRHGAAPFIVRIQNGTAKDRVWTVTLSEGNPGRTLRTETVRQIPVKSGSEVKHEILLPVAPEFTAYSYRRLEVRVTSPGLDDYSRNHGYQTVQTLPTIAMSRDLSTRSLARLDDAAKKRNSSDPRFATSYVPDNLPTSWEGYTGLDNLLITVPEWKGLGDTRRRAVLEWVRLGGQLDLYVAESEKGGFALADLGVGGLPRQDGATWLSLGLLSLHTWDGRELETSVLSRYQGRPKRSEELGDHYDGSWDLADEFGTRSLNFTLIFLLLVAFAVLVAPVNLFYFAGKGRRHRLFLTTPIISVAACLIVILIIFVGDGLGGKGLRVAFADLQPSASEMRLYLSQEQVSRTGVMLQSGFENERQPAIEPVRLQPSPYNALDGGGNRSTSYRFVGASHVGGFFRSRSEQGFVLREAEPTRARIEGRGTVEGSDAPRLVSNLPSPVRSFYFRDENDRVWRTPLNTAVAPGAEFPLQEADDDALKTWLDEETRFYSRELKKRVRSLAREKGRFFSLPDQPASYFIETHPGIRWEESALVLSGRVLAEPFTPASDE